ncbi:MAG: AAA family ATPase [bacterium]
MIKRIIHLADIHIRKSPSRHEEYRSVFKRLYSSIKKQKPDRIVIVGDLVHDYLDLQGEQLVLASEFLNNLADIAPVKIIRGNHDIRKKSLKRTDSIEAIVKALQNTKIEYYNETNIYFDENVVWGVWKHGEKKNDPWEGITDVYTIEEIETRTMIDLFHDPINGSLNSTGYEFKSKLYNNPETFKGEYSFFGDIHKKQYLNDDKTKAYSGSLIAQNYAEGDDEFHGYLLWDIEKKTVKEVSIKNDYSFKNVEVNQFTDFDDLDIEIENPTKYMRIRILWRCLPHTRNNENERKLTAYIKEKYNPISLANKNEFIEEDIIDVDENVSLDDITTQAVQHKIFQDYLEKIGVEDDIIQEIIELDDKVAARINTEEFTGIEWGVVKFSGKNFMSYEELEIDWRDMNGLFQITGLNTAGKTTIMKLLTYILYNKTKETESRMKYGDSRYMNNRLNVKECEGKAVIEANAEYFGIWRRTEITKNKTGEITNASTSVTYYKLDDPDDEFTDDNNVDNLSDEDKNRTQKVIDKTIGTYDNFMRVVMTTSDTINNILSNQKAEFIDAILYDSGLDIFDIKQKEFKEYYKETYSDERITLNEDKVSEQEKQWKDEILLLKQNIENYDNKVLPDIRKRIEKGNEFKDNLVSSLNKIDDEIYGLDVNDIKEQISSNVEQINYFGEKRTNLLNSASQMKEEYDEETLNLLIQQKDEHRQKIYDIRSEIKDIERDKSGKEHEIEKINGEIFLIKKSGAKKKEDYKKLQNSKTCPTCGQPLKDDDQKHIEATLKDIKDELIQYANEIKILEEKIPPIKENIAICNLQIENCGFQINTLSTEIDDKLAKIGELTNEKNEVEKRKEVIHEISTISSQIENLKLKNNIHNKNIELYEKSQKQIEENKTINKKIELAKQKIIQLEQEENQYKDEVYTFKSELVDIENKLIELKEKLKKYKKQQRSDLIVDTYKKCIHRDGIPTQLLINYAIPKINYELGKLLENVDFNIWLDSDDLKLKLAYNNRMDAIIDAISASGKERTFAAICLKFGLNQINAKSKPTIILLDEIMGKLTGNSVEEFIDLLYVIKERVNKLLIVEHNHELNPDHLINVIKDNDVSTLTIE